MRRILPLIPVVLLLLGAQASAQESASFFPLDQGRVWVYDDGNMDKIESFIKVGDGRPPIQAFVFSGYNFARRTFFREGMKVYEWKAGYRRLWYDFGASPGDSWIMAWEPVSGGATDPAAGKNGPPPDAPVTEKDLDDMNTGATMTLVAVGEKVTVPYGEFSGAVHFRLNRPGVSDAGYVEEWFVPGFGCVQRVWDTIAGAHQQRLAKLIRPEPEMPLRMDIAMDKDGYTAGEDIGFTITVLNWSDEDVTLEFPSSLQVDYRIDDAYLYSRNHEAMTVVSKITIPARDVVKWSFTHTAADYAVPIGKHVLHATLPGTKVHASQNFAVFSSEPYIPRGIVFGVRTDKEIYAQGEPVKFTFTVTNRYEQAYDLTIPETDPVKYRLDERWAFPGADAPEPVMTTVSVPAGETISWDGEITADDIALEPGYYALFAGLRGYTDEVYVKFIVQRELTFGTVSGYIMAIPTDLVKSSLDPASGAAITLSPVIPKNYERDMSILPVTDAVFSTKADDQGFFTLEQVPVGAFYVLQVSKEGYQPYCATLRTLEEATRVDVTLRPKLEEPGNQLNYRRHELAGLLITFGTDQSVYTPDSPFKAALTIRNTRAEAVRFTFADEQYVKWSLDSEGGIIELVEDERAARPAGTAEFSITIEPGETREFVRTSTFAGKVPEHGGKYAIRAELRFTGCSIPEIGPGDIGDYIKVLVTPSESNRIEARGHNKEIVVDLRRNSRALINIVTRTDDVAGEVAVTEITKNLHASRDRFRFVTMVDVDADAAIRTGMEHALVRIYYRPEDFGPGFAPEKLVISHWDDKSDHPRWEDLETRVDTVNGFVEATTTSFSSFALFEKDAATGVDQTVPSAFRLEQNTPNPFNPSTTIRFALPAAGTVRLMVYNIAGQEVARLVNGPLPAGTHQVMFEGSRLASGVYFYRLQAPGFTRTRKMLLIK